MEIAILIIVAVLMLGVGYIVANTASKKNAQSRSNQILEEARREAEVLKESRILQAKEEEMKILGDAERTANQKMQKLQSTE